MCVVEVGAWVAKCFHRSSAFQCTGGDPEDRCPASALIQAGSKVRNSHSYHPQFFGGRNIRRIIWRWPWCRERPGTDDSNKPRSIIPCRTLSRRLVQTKKASIPSNERKPENIDMTSQMARRTMVSSKPPIKNRETGGWSREHERGWPGWACSWLKFQW